MNTLPELSDIDDVVYAFSTREDGNMSLLLQDREIGIENREKFLKNAGFELKDTAAMKPLDGDLILEIKDVFQNHAEGEVIQCDGLITNRPGVALTIYPADCPIEIAYDPKHKALGIAHLSWKSTDKKLAQKLIAAMWSAFGSKPEDLVVGMSPGIKKESYTFRDPIQKSLPGWGPFLSDDEEGQTHIDLYAYNHAQIVATGVPADKIFMSTFDTAADTRFFSHYRAVRTGEPEERAVCLVALKP